MPFPYELYPKAKETHCLNLPEISVSRPPFLGSIRTVDGCFWGWRNNNSYVSNSITYNYRVGSTPKAKNYRYGEAFKEKTTRSEGISCNSYANCYIGCSCASGWTQGTAPSSGEYVWATDNRYTGVNSLSVGSGLNASGTIDAQSASSGISASGLSADSGAGISAKSSGSGNYSVSTMGTSGGMTCYKKACPSGYILTAPSPSYAFKYTSTTGTIDLQCYKATGCADGYSSSGTGAGGTYQGYTCKKVQYYYIKPYNTTTSGEIKESGSNFTCASGTVMVGRRHSGDENGKTQYKCASLRAYDESGRSVNVSISIVNAKWDSSYKQSSDHQYRPGSQWIIVGRKHDGDENGQTAFKIAQVKVDGKIASWDDYLGSGEIKESSGTWWTAPSGKVMVGERHKGDENGRTYYYSGRIYLKL